MSDHEFEKRVQQKMDELRLRPSDAVWTEVERNLRRDKRRRRTLLWLPLMGVLLTGGYFLVTATGNEQHGTLATEQSPKSAPQSAPPSVTPSSRPETATAKSATTSAPEREPASTTPASSSTNKSNTSLSENSTSYHQSTVEKKDVVSGTSKKNAVKKPSGKNKDVAALSTTTGVKRTGDKTSKTIPNNNSTDPEPTKSVSDVPATTVNTTTDDANKTEAVKEKENVATVDSITNKKDSVATKQIKQEAKKAVAKTNFPKKQSKWQWGLTASAGAANISEGSVFDMLKAVRVEDLANAPRLYNGIPAAPAPEASPIRTGPTFSIGAFVQRRVSNRISLSLGLQYSYVSVYTDVGKKVDSMVSVNFGNLNTQSQLADRYYSGANSKYEYTNHYHFIEMPLMASWQFMRIGKSPLTLDAGVSVSRLINTNALHFDGFSGVYYENDDFFNRTQVSLNAGLGIGLFEKSRHPLIIGPNIRYYTTGLVKDDVTSSGQRQHIWTFGLNAKMLLKK